MAATAGWFAVFGFAAIFQLIVAAVIFGDRLMRYWNARTR